MNTQETVSVAVTPAAAPQVNAARVTRAASPKLAFRAVQNFRPGSGRSLFAHTAAVFELLGMMRGAKIPRATLTLIMGETAIKYHLAQGSFTQDEKGISLQDFGRAYFSTRSVDPELRAAWIEVLSTGKTNDKVMKNAIGIKAI